MTVEPYECVCPLCGGPNACGNLSADSNPAECWCHQPGVNFSKTLLESVPVADKGKACICLHCVTKTGFTISD